MKITADIADVVARCTATDAGVHLPEQLDRKLYLKTIEAMQAFGLDWSRKAKAVVVVGDEGTPQDALDLLREACATGEVATLRDMRKALGFFPTPAPLAARLVDLAEVREGHVCLEPSAGTGRIVAALQDKGAVVYACERDPKLRQALALADEFIIPVDDFMDVGEKTNDRDFDRVVMNPPFTKSGKGDHLDHVWWAFSLLAVGGVLVSVMPAGVRFREDRRHAVFRGWVGDLDGVIDDLPAHSFRESGTDVGTCVVKVRKTREAVAR